MAKVPVPSLAPIKGSFLVPSPMKSPSLPDPLEELELAGAAGPDD
jgi:hypothetical protein